MLVEGIGIVLEGAEAAEELAHLKHRQNER